MSGLEQLYRMLNRYGKEKQHMIRALIEVKHSLAKHGLSDTEAYKLAKEAVNNYLYDEARITVQDNDR